MTFLLGLPSTLEGWLGLIGSLLVAWAPFRDQILRHRQWTASRKSGAAKPYWDIIAQEYQSTRDSWNFFDSLSLFFGALCLAASFLVTTSYPETTHDGAAFPYPPSAATSVQEPDPDETPAIEEELEPPQSQEPLPILPAPTGPPSELAPKTTPIIPTSKQIDESDPCLQ